MFAHESGWEIATTFKRLDHRAARRRITEGDCDISQPLFIVDSPNRGTFGALQKFFRGPRKQRDERRCIELVPRRKVGFGSEVGVTIPRADQLTVVAAVDTIAEQRSQLFGD